MVNSIPTLKSRAGRLLIRLSTLRSVRLASVKRSSTRPTFYTIIAESEVPPGGAEGVIVSEGGRFGGYRVYLLKGKPVVTWTCSTLSG